jgi:hypothetical protein
MMGTEQVSEASVCSSTLTLLITQEDFKCLRADIQNYNFACGSVWV